MPSKDTLWIITTMAVLAALLLFALYLALGRLEDFAPSAVPRDPQTVLCYEPKGASAGDIAGAIEARMRARTRLELASCIVATWRGNRDHRQLNSFLEDLVQQYGADNLDYVLLTHDVRNPRLNYSPSSD